MHACVCVCVCVCVSPPLPIPLPVNLMLSTCFHHPQEIKVILDLPDKGSLSSPWPKTLTALPLQWDATLKCFYLPSLEKHPLPFFFFFLPEISSLFGRCLDVWQLFSSAWCSILLEGGRWFRRFTATLTDPYHLLPPLPFFCSFFSHDTCDRALHISTDDVNTPHM